MPCNFRLKGLNFFLFINRYANEPHSVPNPCATCIAYGGPLSPAVLCGFQDFFQQFYCAHIAWFCGPGPSLVHSMPYTQCHALISHVRHSIPCTQCNRCHVLNTTNTMLSIQTNHASHASKSHAHNIRAMQSKK